MDPSLSPRWHQTHPGDGSRVATRGAGPQGHGAAAMAGCRTALSPGGKDTELLARQRDGKGTASSLLEESCPKADSISSGFQLMLLRLWPLSVPKHPNSEESRKQRFMVWVGRHLKNHPVPIPSCHEQGHLTRAVPTRP